MSQRVAGIAYAKVDGVQLEISGSFEAPINYTMKETVMGIAGVAGYKETAQRPYVRGEVVFVPGFPVQTLNNISNGTVTVEFANGTIYTLTGAWLEGEIATDGVEGKVTLEFTGTNGSWTNVG